MYLRSVAALQADALFASALQHGDELDISQVRVRSRWPWMPTAVRAAPA